MRWTRAGGLAMCLLIPAVALAQNTPEGGGSKQQELEARVAALETLVAKQQLMLAGAQAQADKAVEAVAGVQGVVEGHQQILEPISREGSDLVVRGVNLRIRNGETCSEDPNGLGNLIVGCNDSVYGADPYYRAGSHNVVVGPLHSYPSIYGLVAGRGNTIGAPYTSVVGGWDNEASAPFSTIGGGYSNVTSGPFSAIAGGASNDASGETASIAGGYGNVASGPRAVVSGGLENLATGSHAAVSGGWGNTASGGAATVSGGRTNVARGTTASVTGGYHNESSGISSTVSEGCSVFSNISCP
jgi:hypothetical protein